MKFSELWLREWVNPPVDSVALINKMTMSGLKVDFLEPVSFYFTGVVIGHIENIFVHPKNSNLQINKINIGDGHLHNVISKSKEYMKNIRVAVATVGATLPGNLEVKCICIEGELSEGILCSFSSLGISYGNIDEIIELPMDAPIGQDLKKYLHLNDNIIDVSITPNRGDCLSIMGIARDVAAMYRLSVKFPKIEYVVHTIDDVPSIFIDDPSVSPYYSARILKNINLSISTPLWVKEKLRRCGIQLTNNVVIDIINYVVLELGHPIQIFDLDNVSGDIYIRWAQKGEKINVPYDKKEVFLSSDTLIIADQMHPIGIAGILVGSDYMVNVLKKTSNIILESAVFDPLCIMRSIKKYGITTYSSYRYERYGINPDISRLALERVTFFLVNICGGSPGKVISVIHQDIIQKEKIIFLYRLKVNKLLGYIIPDHEIIDILVHIGCKIKEKNISNVWKVFVPLWRFDINIEEDLIEEIIRLYGYDRIPKFSFLNKASIVKQCKIIESSLSQSKKLLVDLGYQEIITYSFVDQEMQYLLYPNIKSILLLNPLTSDMSVMRSSLWVGLLKTLLYNQSRQQKNIRLFEFGKCFTYDQTNESTIHQCFMLSGVITGSRFDEHWDMIPDKLDFYDIKGDVEALLEINGKLHDVNFKSQIHSVLHPGQSGVVFLKKEHIGFFGAIHPILEKKLNLRTRVFLFEFFWEKIEKNTVVSKIIDVPKFPISRRDISIVVSENISAEAIILECKKSIKDQLINIKLFDVYRGEDIPKGFKSVSIGLYLYHWSHTLQEEEIQLIITQCLSALYGRFHACLREKHNILCV